MFVWLQIGTPWFDGTEGVTQCPISPGETFTYKFVVDRVSSLTTILLIILTFWAIKIFNQKFYLLIEFGLANFINLNILCTAWDILVPCTLRYAKRSRVIRINSCIASPRRVWTIFLWLWSKHHFNWLVSQEHIRTISWPLFVTLCLGWRASGKI